MNILPQFIKVHPRGYKDAFPHSLPPPLLSYVTMRGADVIGTGVGSAVAVCLFPSAPGSPIFQLPALPGLPAGLACFSKITRVSHGGRGCFLGVPGLR